VNDHSQLSDCAFHGFPPCQNSISTHHRQGISLSHHVSESEAVAGSVGLLLPVLTPLLVGGRRHRNRKALLKALVQKLVVGSSEQACRSRGESDGTLVFLPQL